jgi:hypothetical protein
MSFEEGIERLKERHEALTQSVELLLLTAKENTENIGKLVEISNRDAVDIAALARIAESRERRINGLEEGRA